MPPAFQADFTVSDSTTDARPGSPEIGSRVAEAVSQREAVLGWAWEEHDVVQGLRRRGS